ncbi:MAG: GntR family transcriptional regulator [Nitratireductor sp.]|nr:GntR family transcriptional regulator [Nitratireductor sp.]
MTDKFKQIKGVSLADQAREVIRSAVLNGSIKPGEKITIEDVAMQLGISRTPVREALKALEGDGMVRLLPHRGAIVEPFALDEVRIRYVVAGMLEGYAAELACKRQGSELAEKLEANCRELARLCKKKKVTAAQVRELVATNRAFHDLIREGSGSQTLVRLLDTLRQPSSYSQNYWSNPESRQISLEIHQAITEAFRAEDPILARKLVEKHLSEARERLITARRES